MTKVIRIPLPRPKQRGWQFIGIQNNCGKLELVYIRRRWKNKEKEKARQSKLL